MTGEWTLVFGFKSEFNRDYAWSENQLLYEVAISRKGSGKWASELIADCLFSFHQQARNLEYYIFGVVRHDPIQVRSGPRVVVLTEKQFDVKCRVECRRKQAGDLLGCFILQHLLSETPSSQRLVEEE